MNQETVLKLACEKVGAELHQVSAWRVYDDRVAIVLNLGIAGSKKHTIELSELKQPEKELEPDTDTRKRTRRTRSTKGGE